MLLLIVGAIIALLLIRYYGISPNGGFKKQVRHAFIYLYLWMRKRRTGPMFGFNMNTRDLKQLGITSLAESELRETPRTLVSDLNAMDSIGFCGTSNDGNSLIVRIVRCHDRRSEILVHLRLNTGEEYEHPVHPDCHVSNTDGRTFSAGGLTFDILMPLMRWRISFNGILRKVETGRNHNDGLGIDVPVKFTFIWKPINNYIGFPHDFDPSIMAKTMARQQTGSIGSLIGTLSNLTNDEEWSEQFGQIHGTVVIDGQEERPLLLRGLKDRKYGIKNWKAVKQNISIKGVSENGTSFHFFKQANKLMYGYVCAPCTTVVRHVKDWPTDIGELMDKDHFTMTVKAGDRHYKLDMDLDNDSLRVFQGPEWNFQNRIRVFKMKFNGKSGYGFVECGHSVHEQQLVFKKQQSLPQLKEPESISSDRLVLSLDELACQSSKLVGGKGSSLALMASLDQTWLSNEFEVPKGVCIQKLAFEQHLNKHQNLKAAIKTLEDVAWQRQQGSLVEECNGTVKLVETTKLSNSLKCQLEQWLKTIFGDGFESMKFAIRSSAIGEDGEEMSAAGQNETFLGIKGLEEICSATVQCWASQFSHRSVEYKRQNGQLLNGGMAVVVQQMVPADVAGVLFTSHPVTGSRAQMLISSNYGLGESVVSGSADPDAIILRRSWTDKLDILEKQVGQKKIKIAMSENNGVIESEIDSAEASKMTLTDEMALRLGKIAIFLELSWGSARDIEWATKDDKIYLLQSRPVTSDNIFTEFDVFHEFDTSTLTDTEHFSTGNVGEVLPGSVTPLTLSTALPLFTVAMMNDYSWKHLRHRYDPTSQVIIEHFYGHLFLSRIKEKFWTMSKKKSGPTKAMEIGIYGRVLDDDDVLQLAIDRAEEPPRRAYAYIVLTTIKGMLFGKWIAERAERQYSRYQEAGAKALTSHDLYKQIEENLADIAGVMNAHAKLTFASSAWNMAVFSILAQGDGDYSMALYRDFAKLVGECNGTESGDAPLSIMRLIEAVAKETSSKEFAKMTPAEGLKWIEKNGNDCKRLLNEFMERHGHRCSKEMDVSAISWEMEPEKLIKVIQDTLRNYNPNTMSPKKEEQVVDVIQQMETKLTLFRKFMLSLILRGSKSGICRREKTKSLVVKVIDGFRKAYRHLARLMVAEGLIPDADLLFYFTHQEIGKVIDTRSAKIIRRAQHRKRLHPKMDRMAFPQLIAGFPKPNKDDDDDDLDLEHLVQVTGYPVSPGKVKGPARVIYHFDDVYKIQPGDILITHATDIGWSPYFPMLAGVVTEIGGLISHGAVVAREFGLPCVIGTQNATKVFKSGEIILLDAFKGIVAKVPE